MAAKHDLVPNKFKFIYLLKFVSIIFFILVVILAYFTVLITNITYTYDYRLERPTEPIQPADPVLLSLHISFAELQNVSSLAQTLTNDSNDPQKLLDCNVLLLVATRQLNQSINLLTVGQGDHEAFVGPDILAVHLLIKASLDFQDKCFHGLEKIGSTVLNDFRARLQRSKQCTINSLDILREIYPVRFRAFRRRTCLFKYICATSNLSN